jgi:hypothetical protein
MQNSTINLERIIEVRAALFDELHRGPELAMIAAVALPAGYTLYGGVVRRDNHFVPFTYRDGHVGAVLWDQDATDIELVAIKHAHRIMKALHDETIDDPHDD